MVVAITLALKVIPAEVLKECRESAGQLIHQGKPVNRKAAAVIIAIWRLLAVLGIALIVILV